LGFIYLGEGNRQNQFQLMSFKSAFTF